ncbi:transferase hexapeptide repeat family protein [Pseudomaricurvus alkylphenolicus]|uniref:acyltransferase n=1 Tax=Pseudomaricurvus alkylphenolicus TaxID=1306991 RepID=UPI001423982C|nr:transferase hexapeptide repeat family protein [Pseudomaricurvus alkylphenolicus]NIB40320.1 transferase hexapeptide repeat family protein [Pseudomaricurvus alkylphenolicus]
MKNIYEIDGVRPVIAETSYVHPNAVIIGDVIIGENCYIGPQCSIRGDYGRITIADGANIQDNCVLHSFPGKPCSVGSNAHISHGAILHGCTVKNNGFVGINAVVMDDAIVGEGAMVAAMAFVKAAFEIDDHCLAVGQPAKIVKEMSTTEVNWTSNGPKTYQRLAQRSMATLKPTTPLTTIEADRPELDLNKETSKPLHILKKSL